MRRPGGSVILASVATVVVLAAVIGGLVVLGPPSEERARRLDERRTDDLREIQGVVELFWSRHQRLPATLEELAAEPGTRVARDPATREAYDYRVLDEKRYEICARFDRDSSEARTDRWSHAAGRHCFPFTTLDLDLH